MRRVDAEGDSRGVRGQKQVEARYRSRLRRAAIEWLERRELLSTSTSTLPSPTVISAPLLSGSGVTQGVSFEGGNPLTASTTEIPSANSPSVSVDPNNPLRMVATWVDHDTPGFNAGNYVSPVTDYVAGAFSTDGGETWNALPANAFQAVDTQTDFSITPPTNGTVNKFTMTNNASIAFDRNENFYILSTSHSAANTAGVLDLSRFNFSGTTPTYTGLTSIYSWDQADSASHSGTSDAVATATLAVDSNLPTFTDPTTNTTVTDQFSGNIYAVWSEVDSNTYGGIPGFNPDTIRMAASSDQGALFTAPAYVDDSSNANQGGAHSGSGRYAAPQVTISQGNGTIPGGQVTIVYDDFGTIAPLDQILDQTSLLGGTSEQFSAASSLLGPNTFATATINNTTVITAQNLNQRIPIAVNITDPKFISLQALELTTTIDYPTMGDMTITLFPPATVTAATGITQILLFQGNPNGVNRVGNSLRPGPGPHRHRRGHSRGRQLHRWRGRGVRPGGDPLDPGRQRRGRRGRPLPAQSLRRNGLQRTPGADGRRAQRHLEFHGQL